jgi:hypothetical protein
MGIQPTQEDGQMNIVMKGQLGSKGASVYVARWFHYAVGNDYCLSAPAILSQLLQFGFCERAKQRSSLEHPPFEERSIGSFAALAAAQRHGIVTTVW